MCVRISRCQTGTRPRGRQMEESAQSRPSSLALSRALTLMLSHGLEIEPSLSYLKRVQMCFVEHDA